MHVQRFKFACGQYGISSDARTQEVYEIFFFPERLDAFVKETT